MKMLLSSPHYIRLIPYLASRYTSFLAFVATWFAVRFLRTKSVCSSVQLVDLAHGSVCLSPQTLLT